MNDFGSEAEILMEDLTKLFESLRKSTAKNGVSLLEKDLQKCDIAIKEYLENLSKINYILSFDVIYKYFKFFL